MEILKILSYEYFECPRSRLGTVRLRHSATTRPQFGSRFRYSHTSGVRSRVLRVLISVATNRCRRGGNFSPAPVVASPPSLSCISSRLAPAAVVTGSIPFFSRPRSEGWPHRGRTFSIHPGPVILTDSSTRSPVRCECVWSCGLTNEEREFCAVLRTSEVRVLIFNL